MKSKRVLFVGGDVDQFARLRADAEQKALPWEMVSVDAPPKAFVELEKGETDVLVAQSGQRSGDVQPLLARVKRDSPRTARLAMVGKPAEAAASLGGGVQRVPAGCDAVTLAGFIDRGCALQQIVADPAVAKLAGNLDRLPSVPSTYWALTRAANDPDTSVSDIAKIVQSDPAMSLKVLHLVNSAFFGLARRTTSIADAVALLGLDQLKGLVLATHVFGALEGRELKHFSLETFQRYSVRVGRLAKSFLKDRALAEDAFTAGILHDVGKVVLALREPEKFDAVLERVARTGEPIEGVERELLGLTHAMVGAYLLSTWEIPFPIVECVAFHHEPAKLPPTGSAVVAVVHAADALIGITCCGEPGDRLDTAFLQRAGFAAQVPEWKKKVEAECEVPGGRG